MESEKSICLHPIHAIEISPDFLGDRLCIDLDHTPMVPHSFLEHMRVQDCQYGDELQMMAQIFADLWFSRSNVHSFLSLLNSSSNIWILLSVVGFLDFSRDSWV